MSCNGAHNGAKKIVYKAKKKAKTKIRKKKYTARKKKQLTFNDLDVMCGRTLTGEAL